MSVLCLLSGWMELQLLVQPGKISQRRWKGTHHRRSAARWDDTPPHTTSPRWAHRSSADRKKKLSERKTCRAIYVMVITFLDFKKKKECNFHHQLKVTVLVQPSRNFSKPLCRCTLKCWCSSLYVKSILIACRFLCNLIKSRLMRTFVSTYISFMFLFKQGSV